MVEGTGLENRRTGNGIVSSNLTLSAAVEYHDALVRGSACQRVRRVGRGDRVAAGAHRLAAYPPA